ncbi:hypothetical protein BSL78_17406 [Apostichopus japonicus]|uniref:Uncharacterized protein n=1 Tax=Stichopus japonicus TaxID=307972 RepID=A0A2G8KCK2_STIJA|nr:hypothetical protein BSL78_17406 [Apostichopus japonicus]
MKLRKLTRVSAADFIIAHLDGPARREIRHRPSKLSSDPDKILDVLRDMFGERYTLGSLMRQECNCTQGDRESTSDPAFRLMALAEKLSTIDDAPNPERTIREQFCDGLRDKTLRRELKRLLKMKLTCPTSNFETGPLIWEKMSLLAMARGWQLFLLKRLSEISSLETLSTALKIL